MNVSFCGNELFVLNDWNISICGLYVPKRRTNRDKPFDRFLCALLYVLSGFVEKFKNSAPQTLAKMFPP